MAQVPVKALKRFNRTIDNQMVVGSPTHRDVKGRYLLVSTAGAEELRLRGDAKVISRAAYDAVMRGEAEPAEDAGEAGGGKSQAGRDAGTVRQEQVDRRGRGDVQAAKLAELRATVPSITMSRNRIREIADAVGADISKSANRAESVKTIKARQKELAKAGGDEGGQGGEAGGGKSQDPPTVAGIVGSATTDSTNHPTNTGPHKDANAAGTLDNNTIGADGVTDEDAAPRGGGGPAPE